jgi:hypothetical protein
LSFRNCFAFGLSSRAKALHEGLDFFRGNPNGAPDVRAANLAAIN